MRKFLISLLLSQAFLGAPVLAPAFAADRSAETIRSMAANEQSSAISLYREFLSFPNDANNPEDIATLIEWMEGAFAERGFTTSRLATAGSPALFAERRVDPSKKTALIYLQADGQPVDPSKWAQPSPWAPVLKKPTPQGDWEIIDWPTDGKFDPEWRIFARSASDSKGPMTQFLTAVDAIDHHQSGLDYNLKVIIDTEEELGSPHLADAVAKNRDLLRADFLLIFDGPPHASNRPTVSFGARGITTITLTTYGPKAAQHSGHYGNFVPNPGFALARLLSSMKDPSGRVRIKGFYDGVTIDKATQKILSAVPDDPSEILGSMGLTKADQVAPTLQEALQYPSLNIRGLSSAWVGEQARTIIPPTATAEIDIRTVKETSPERLVALVKSHIEKQGFKVLDHAPSDEERLAHEHIVTMTHEISYNAFRSDFDTSAGIAARAGMRRLYGEEPILIRTLGGSIPIAPFVDILDIPAAIVPTVNIDNNQHSPNENLRVGSFFEGIAILTSVLAEK